MDSQTAIIQLKCAIANVSPNYVYICKGCNSSNCTECSFANSNNTYFDLHVERCFAYELYHQWSILLKNYKSAHSEDNNLVLSGEIPKNTGKPRDKYPDIILHSGQNNGENQILVCEIKRCNSSSSHVVKDLVKLVEYLNLVPRTFGNRVEDVKYDHAVFIMTNISADNLKEKIKAVNQQSEDYLKLKNSKDVSKITCIAVEHANDVLRVNEFNLSEIIHS